MQSRAGSICLRGDLKVLSRKQFLIALTIFVAVVVVLSFLPMRYQACETNQYTEHEYCASYQMVAYAFVKIMQFLDHYGSAFTALATIAIAGFTATLWYSTNGMLQATKDAVDLTRDEFNATHRPKLFVHTVTVIDKGRWRDKSAKGIITVVNGGDSPAFVIEWRAIIYYQHPEAAFVPGLDVEPVQTPNPAGAGIGAGEWQDIGHSQVRGVDDDWDQFIALGGRMFFLGRITYKGSDGVRRNVGFCREYDAETEGAWRVVKQSEYEYAY